MERRQSSKFMNILGVIIDETSSAKKKKVPKGLKKQADKRHLRYVDEDWLRRCSANSLPLASADDHHDDEQVVDQPKTPTRSRSSKLTAVHDAEQVVDRPKTPKRSRSSKLTAACDAEQVVDQPKTPKRSRSSKLTAVDDAEQVVDQPKTLKRSRSSKLTAVDDADQVVDQPKTPKRSSSSKLTDVYDFGFDQDDLVDQPKPKRFRSSKLTAVYDDYDEMVNQTEGASMKLAARKRNIEMRKAKGTLKNVNDNFVRVDVEKKRYVRGKKKVTGAKTKRTDWKQRKSFANKEARVKTSKCHKCGEIGHYAMYCLKDLIDNDFVPEITDNSPFPTLEEAARMNWSRKDESAFNKLPQLNVTDEIVKSEPGLDTESVDHNTSDAEISLEGQFTAQSETFILAMSTVKSVDPILSTGDCSEDQLLKEGLEMFQFESFRPGQREAIVRVLQGVSTLLVLGTGCGKSLCYQLPAYLYAKKYPGVLSLCVSPLVSLMEDQVKHVPDFLNAACLHTQMTTRQKEIVLDKIKQKKLDILLVSPEAICSGLFGLLRNVDDFPPVAFACIDEVHCVSEWSHNFRPSYLKLCKVLREKLNIQTILGLTATATNYTAFSVCEHLKIDPSSRIQGELLPSNLNLSVSRDAERDHALIELLHGERFKSCDSIIIYCTRRNECERVVSLIRTALMPIGSSKAGQIVCDAYHAGQRAAHRRRVQNDFMAGKIRIVVATVAFGMGINKSDIRAIIHYNMPKTFESYVQEIGRAGRDGESAECHVFLGSSKGKDLAELRRHIYGNYIDRSTLRNLIKTIFKPCKCGRIDKLKGVSPAPEDKNKKRKCCGHEVSFSVNGTSLELDLAEENIETLLCYLELDTKRKWVEILPKCYQYCRIQTYGGAKLLLSKARTCPPLAAAIAMQKENRKFKEGNTHLEFNLVELASSLGWNSAVVRRELKSLEWTGIKFDDEGKPTAFRKSGVLVEFSDLAHRVIVPGDLTDDDYDDLLNALHGRCVQQERMQLYQLQKTHEAFQIVSTANILSACDAFDRKSCEKLKSMILEYFSQQSVQVPSDWKHKSDGIPDDMMEIIRQDILNLLASHRETTFTGRAVAKIFQGITSPCFPADQWSRNRSFWRKHIDLDFHALVRVATEEVVKWQ